MQKIYYAKFNQLDPADFLPILNEESIRDHLISHRRFDVQSVTEWVKGKIISDAMPGCRIRAVYSEGALVGWCGIQQDNEDFEIAIVISPAVWGIGLSIFKALMAWSKELGHQEVVIHLLETRPVYKFLKRKAIKVKQTEMLGRSFMTYHLAV